MKNVPSGKLRWWDILSRQVQEVLGVSGRISSGRDTAKFAGIKVFLWDGETLLQF